MRPLYRSPVRKVVYDKGTDNEQTVTLPRQTTYLELFMNKFGWFLHRISFADAWDNKGYGFYMSQPEAHRIYWVWRRTRWCLFWSPRTKRSKTFEVWRYK